MKKPEKPKMNKVDKHKYTKRFGQYDRYLLLLVLALSGFGCLMIYSASSFNCSVSAACNFDGMFYVKQQIIKGILPGIVFMIALYFVNYRIWQNFDIFALVVAFVSVAALKSPLARESHGAFRWVAIGPISFQVAEIVKLCLIIFLASRLAKRYRYLSYKKGFMASYWLLTAIFVGALVKISSNLSSALILMAICYCMTLVSSKNYKFHIVLFLLAVVGTIGIVMWFSHHLPDPSELTHYSYRWKRIIAWLAPQKYASSIGYQILQALYAVANGGFFGKGLGQGIQKLKRIPEAQNDMIFAIICEELGIIGGIIVLMAYVVLIFLIIRIGLEAWDRFGTLMCMGIATQIGVQAFINVGVAVNFLPNTGASLPFISYGGTSVALLFAEIGIVLSVRRVKVRDQSRKDFAYDQKVKREEQKLEEKNKK